MKKIDLMHSMFGRTAEKKCKDCSHFKSIEFSRTYYKCEVYGLSHSEATDWRVNYPACGLFNKFTSYEDVYKSAKSDNTAIPEGQMSLFEVAA